MINYERAWNELHDRMLKAQKAMRQVGFTTTPVDQVLSTMSEGLLANYTEPAEALPVAVVAPTTEGDPVPALPPDAPLAGEKWIHWKNGTIVEVLGSGRHTETMEAVVTYTHDGRIWVRPLAQWADQVRPGVQRFVWIDK